MTQTRRARLADVFAYVGIGIVVAVGGVLYGIYTAERGLDPHLPMAWISLVLTTVLGLGYVARSHRSAWKRPAFWVTMTLCLAAHLLLLWVPTVLTLGNRVLLILGLRFRPEYLLITALLEWLLRPQTPGRD